MTEHERLVKIETLLTGMKEKVDEIHKQTLLTNGRVTKLELWKAGVMGKVAGIGIAIGALAWIVTNLIK